MLNDPLPIPPTPERITRAVLESLPDDSVEYSLLSYAIDQIGDDLLYDNPAFLALPTGLRTHLVASVVDGEVLNGGFNQLFFNSSGQLAPAAPEAFENLGVPEAADLMREALRIHIERAPTLDEAREDGSVEAFISTYDSDPFQALDQRYGALHDLIAAARLRYIRANPDQFLHP